MKKNLFIVRHGHAQACSNDDFSRNLTTQGIQAVNHTAEFIQKTCQQMGINLSVCISSAANRTRQTAEIICAKNAIEEVLYFTQLYATVPGLWLEHICQSTHTNILIVGHNPTLSQLLNHLCGERVHMQPAHCAFVTLEIKADGIIYPAQLHSYFNHA